MQIDKAWRDDETAGINRIRAFQRLRGDVGDSTIPYSDIPHSVELRLRIHDASAQDHAVESRLRQVNTPACARNRRHTGLGRSSRCPAGVRRPVASSRPNTTMEFDRWCATSSHRSLGSRLKLRGQSPAVLITWSSESDPVPETENTATLLCPRFDTYRLRPDEVIGMSAG